MHTKTLKIDPELHRLLKACVSRQARHTIQEYVEAALYTALCKDYGEGTISSMINEQDDQNGTESQLFQSLKSQKQPENGQPVQHSLDNK